MGLKRKDYAQLALAIGGPLLGGQLAALTTIKDIKGWYTRIKKPRWTPPNWLFGAIWPVLYVGQGVSSWLVWRAKGAKRALPLSLYGAQLVLNWLWQPLMFKFHRPDVATWESVLMLGTATAATAVMADTVSSKKAKAAILGTMGPYVGWLAFATALSAAIARDNPNAQDIDASPAPATTKPPKAPKVPKADAAAATASKDPIKTAGQAALERQKAT